MNLNKHREFFDPLKDTGSIHIIGVGAVGSTIAEQLVRLGVEKLHIYDYDVVSPHNITNQMFFDDQIGRQKTDAIKETLQRINPSLSITIHPMGYGKQPLAGTIFLCVDSIELRKNIATQNQYNPNITAMFDCRMRLTDAQHYAADWSKPKSVETFIDSMQFTSEEAKADTPISACGTTLSVNPTVRILCSYCVSNYINFVNSGTLTQFILLDAFKYATLAI